MQIVRSSYQTRGALRSTFSVREQVVESLRTSREYRHSFVEEKIRTGLAAQIRASREKKDGGLTQKRLAEMLGKSQSWVARLEDPNEALPTIRTLLRVAYVLDVDLVVRFAPFSELADWVSGTPHLSRGLSPQTLAVEDFEHDLGLIESRQVRGRSETSSSALGSQFGPVASARIFYGGLSQQLERQPRPQAPEPDSRGADIPGMLVGTRQVHEGALAAFAASREAREYQR